MNMEMHIAGINILNAHVIGSRTAWIVNVRPGQYSESPYPPLPFLFSYNITHDDLFIWMKYSDKQSKLSFIDFQ